jgi:NADPH-dependent 2,4-dienoyl-CoA reductase/sulfur reductase-like enzyme
VGDGVLCGPDLAVADRVVVAGDIARWRLPDGSTRRVEHWDNAARQGEFAAAALLDPGKQIPYATTTMFWSDQFDLKLHVVGHPEPGDLFAVVEGSLHDRQFVGAYTSGDILHAAVLCNQSQRLRTYREAVQNGTLPISVGHRAVPA